MPLHNHKHSQWIILFSCRIQFGGLHAVIVYGPGCTWSVSRLKEMMMMMMMIKQKHLLR